MGEYLFLKFHIVFICDFVMCEHLICVCRSWFDSSFDGVGHHRQVNQVLGNLVRHHWPGVVTDPGSGEVIPVTQWEHFKMPKEQCGMISG